MTDKKLCWAARQGQLEKVARLLAAADVTEEGVSDALFAAALRGHQEMIELLLKDKRVKPDEKGNYLIRRAAGHGYVKTMEMLLGMVDPTLPNHDIMIFAAAQGHLEIVKLLVRDGRVVMSHKAFIMALEAGHLEVATFLMKTGRVNPSFGGYHAFDIAISNGYMDLVNIMLEDHRVTNFDYIFKSAVNRDTSLELVKLLLKDPRVDPGAQNLTDLNWPVPAPPVLKLLLDDGRIHPSTYDNEAIIMAAKYNRVEAVELLLRHPKVDPAARDNAAIREAAELGRLKVIQVLLKDKRVDPTARENEAIIQAKERKHRDVVQFLLTFPKVRRGPNMKKFKREIKLYMGEVNLTVLAVFPLQRLIGDSILIYILTYVFRFEEAEFWKLLQIIHNKVK